MITNDGNIRSGTHLHWQLMGNLAVDKSNSGPNDLKWGVLQNRREYFLNQLEMTTENHVDFGIYQTKNPFRLNIYGDTRVEFGDIYNKSRSYNIKYKDDWAQSFSGKETNNILDNYPTINKYLIDWTIKNVPNYSGSIF